MGTVLPYTNKEVTVSYVYDSLGQIVRENNPIAGKTWTWTYDLNGNILSRSEYAYTTGELGEATDTVTYSYGNSTWKDQLTSYDGNTITYDTLGNPLKLHNGKALTWSGRTLTGVGNYTYSYNADGLLTAVSSGTSTSEIIRDTEGKVYSYNGLKYFYDSNGKPLGFTYGSYEYYFRYNLQGDVTGLINAATGNIDAFYEYDSHGNILSRVAVSSITSNICRRNVFLYRGAYGYFYDSTSGLYYLQTRFYDPVIGRFLNADDTDYLNASGTTLGCNLYAYCENDVVNSLDPNGRYSVSRTFVMVSIDIIIGLVASYVKFAYDAFGSVLRYGFWRNGYRYFMNTLAGSVPKILSWGSRALTALRTVFWRIGFGFMTYILNKLSTGLVWICNWTLNLKWNSNTVNIISCLFSTGGIIALFLDYITDGRMDDRIKLW